MPTLASRFSSLSFRWSSQVSRSKLKLVQRRWNKILRNWIHSPAVQTTMIRGLRRVQTRLKSPLRNKWIKYWRKFLSRCMSKIIIRRSPCLLLSGLIGCTRGWSQIFVGMKPFALSWPPSSKTNTTPLLIWLTLLRISKLTPTSTTCTWRPTFPCRRPPSHMKWPKASSNANAPTSSKNSSQKGSSRALNTTVWTLLTRT